MAKYISSALSDTSNSTSAVKPSSKTPSEATTGPSVTVTTSTPVTFKTASPPDRIAAAVSEIS